MNNTLVLNIARFIILIILQVILFNNIELFGFITPFPYILFILLYPLNTNRASLLILSFLLGLILDFYNNSGGVHAGACLVLAYFRETFLKTAYGISYEYHMLKITEKINGELLGYLGFSVPTHHTVMYVLEVFSFSFIWDIFLRILASSAFTLLVIILVIALIKQNPKR